MHIEARQFARLLTTAAVAAAFTLPTSLPAQTGDHLVTPSELQQSAVAASEARQKNIDILRKALSSPQAEKAFKEAHADPEEVKKAVSSLNDQELAQLASRAEKAQKEFAAGGISDMQLVLILLAIILLILLIALV